MTSGSRSPFANLIDRSPPDLTASETKHLTSLRKIVPGLPLDDAAKVATLMTKVEEAAAKAATAPGSLAALARARRDLQIVWTAQSAIRVLESGEPKEEADSYIKGLDRLEAESQAIRTKHGDRGDLDLFLKDAYPEA